jgi:hypothetical protein
VDPNSTPIGATQSIKITGTGFAKGNDPISVQSVNPAGDKFNVNSPTQITAIVPDTLSGGRYNVAVRTREGATSPNTVLFFVTPKISHLTPNTGPFTGDTQVTVSGTGFVLPTGSSPFTTKFFLISPNNPTPVPVPWSECRNVTECAIATPPGAAGVVDLVACVGDSGTGCSERTTDDHFLYTGPTVTGFSPSHGPVTGGTWVEIGGASLPHDGSIQTFFGDVQAPQLEGCPPIFTSDTCIRALSPHGVSQVPITVRIVGSSAPPSTAPGVFTYDPQAALTEFGYDPGRTDPGWVVLNGFAPGPDGAPVSITSSEPAALPPKTTVTVLAGGSAASFTLNFLPVPATETVTLTASYGGSSLKTTVRLAASPPLSIGIGADHLSKGDMAPVTVTLNTPAPANPAGGAVVMLSSSDSSAVPVPPNVTVPTGSDTKSFTITNNYSGPPKQVTIAATYNGASASNSLFVPTAPPPPTNDCTHCRTPEQCCVCNGGVWNRGRCE